MCGITGIYAFNEVGRFFMPNLSHATDALESRGPDFRHSTNDHFVGLGHRRLSIIDTTPDANQPMWDESGRYGIVYNGEIYNYESLKTELVNAGVSFFSHSDTEVLLKLFIYQGKEALQKVNGFFAFAVYDRHATSLFLARDRFGIKPLYYYTDEDKFLFGSQLNAILTYNIPREPDYVSLYQYLQLTYIPAPASILKGVKKLEPGHYMYVDGEGTTISRYYQLSTQLWEQPAATYSYEEARDKITELLEDSVRQRLVADVPVGTFLSGGIDSSFITALASRHTDQLNTFSLGFKSASGFDETHYAELVAERYQTNHQTFRVAPEDMLHNIQNIMDSMDEPFADSSSIAVYMLSKLTRQHVKVALSGDGADELFGGYNKYMAEYRLRANPFLSSVIKSLGGLWKTLPQSRDGYLSNKIRQLERFASGSRLSFKERHWYWSCFTYTDEATALLNNASREQLSTELFEERKDTLLKALDKGKDFNHIFLTDFEMVLQNDMLRKADLMSMANSLEVRVPFLDHNLVEFTFALPSEYKIGGQGGKKILKDAAQQILPKALFERGKQGFDVPLAIWLCRDLKPMIKNELLDDDFIREQNIFNPEATNKLKKQLDQGNIGNQEATLWSLMIFQHWWKRYMH